MVLNRLQTNFVVIHKFKNDGMFVDVATWIKTITVVNLADNRSHFTNLKFGTEAKLNLVFCRCQISFKELANCNVNEISFSLSPRKNT